MKRFIYLFGLFIPLALLGCGDKDMGTEPVSGIPEMISLAGVETEVTAGARAASDFPNSQRIGVIAADYSTGFINWNSYPDIDNEGATATGESGNIFSFTWDTPKYWPMDDSELVFLAYSPPSNGTSVTLNNTGTAVTLALQLTQDTPDVMYASNNLSAATAPHKKTDGIPVDLGAFTHVLSKITVEVIPGENMNPAVRIAELTVTSTVTTGTLDLLTGALAPGGPTGGFTYNVVTASTAFNSGFSKDIYFFPGTHGQTTVYIKFTDGYFEVDGTYTVNDFENIDTQANDLQFVQGEHTTLRFTVVGTLVQEPDENIVLQGQLTDWYDNDDLQLIIQ